MDVLARKSLGDVQNDLEETRKVVETAESRARLRRGGSNSKLLRGNERQFAEALHREADRLYHSGDYEAALVLYHRAAGVYPRDSGHGIAARRTAATISCWSNPPRAVRKLLPDAGSEAELAVSFCPESAALRAAAVLKGSPNASSITEVLKYFDCHKSLWTTLPSVPSSPRSPSRKGTMSCRANSAANATLRNLEAAFDSGRIRSSLKFAKDLLGQSRDLLDPHRYQIAAYHYLSLIHVALGRHDRAVSNVARMVRLSRISEDSIMFSRALVTLGKVHLSFGHLDAAARAWENMSRDLEDPVPRAWIQHEIGRCYLETGRYRRALEASSRCLEAAEEVDSQKWILHGRLLKAQAMLKMGRFAEALEELRVCERITEEEGDTPMLSYVRDLVIQVTQALRKVMIDRDDFLMDKIDKSFGSTERRGSIEAKGSKIEYSSDIYNKNKDNPSKEISSRKLIKPRNDPNASQASKFASSFKASPSNKTKMSKEHSSLQLKAPPNTSDKIEGNKVKRSASNNPNTLNHSPPKKSQPIKNNIAIKEQLVKPSFKNQDNPPNFPTKEASMTTVFAQRNSRSVDSHNESSNHETSEDESEEITMRPTSMQSPYRRWSSKRANVRVAQKPSEDAILVGGRTFRIESPARARGTADDSSLSSSSSSSSSIAIEEDGDKRTFQDALEEPRRDVSSVETPRTGLEREPGWLDRGRGKIRSARSGETGVTYVIEEDRRIRERGAGIMEERRGLEESEESFHSLEDSFRSRVPERRESMNFYSNGSTVSRGEIETLFKATREESEELSRMIARGTSSPAVEVKDDWTEELRLLEELDDEEGKELLEMLQKMMLSTTDELPASGGLGNSATSLGRGLAFGRLREEKEDELKVASILHGKAQERGGSHSLYRHSLPPSPRKCGVDEVSHTCEGCSKSYGSS
ncbi:hypothetical protein KM043_010312 [Ampulex compressa]|nr:hypothetical protein KM043_010312 [Ampulex compressa]